MGRPVTIALSVLVVLLALGGLWQWLTVNDIVTVNSIRAWVAASPQWRDSPWVFALVTVVYVIALLVMFPLSILVAVTGLIFGPVWGFVYATIGTLASSVVSYAVGHRLGREALMNYGGKHMKGLSHYLSRRGIRAMTLINLLPLAPFTLTNMMAGAFHIKFRDYMIGSTLGIVPGLAAVTLLGSQLGALVTASAPRDIVLSLAGLGLGILLLFALRYYSRRKSRAR
ncbi:TVP38/TMEM64 family protein [Halomonas sp. SpR1]|uniref:TVP38/TMEM64 family protein n=1 Tax=Halomonas sp. SpR1 TaxID=3050462 RepID=UPI0027E48DBD|nr:TVP38/TMEM64 family protein [Halomonas sp. SpR1]MDQ7735093.1 TVP38/TMEM64 family protein [Halomonas sp. SpR1]